MFVIVSVLVFVTITITRHGHGSSRDGHDHAPRPRIFDGKGTAFRVWVSAVAFDRERKHRLGPRVVSFSKR